MKRFIKIVAAFMLPFALATFSGAQDVIQIKGSDTIVNLAQRMAEVYMQKNPGKALSVTGGGSGTGIAALVNKTVDVANSSRDIKAKEILLAQNAGVNPVRTVIAMDCITVVVNEANRLDKLSVAQLGAIFRGEITNWKDVGGDNMPITLYGRQSNSGTFVFFMDTILKGDYSDRMNRMNGTSQIVEAVKSDKTGIGYVGLGHARSATGLRPVKLELPSGVLSDPMNKADRDGGKYPIIRTLNQYTDGKPAGTVKDFMSFELSPEGQKIVEDMGFMTVPEEYEVYNKQNSGI